MCGEVCQVMWPMGGFCVCVCVCVCVLTWACSNSAWSKALSMYSGLQAVAASSLANGTSKPSYTYSMHQRLTCLLTI